MSSAFRPPAALRARRALARFVPTRAAAHFLVSSRAMHALGCSTARLPVFCMPPPRSAPRCRRSWWAHGKRPALAARARALARAAFAARHGGGFARRRANSCCLLPAPCCPMLWPPGVHLLPFTCPTCPMYCTLQLPLPLPHPPRCCPPLLRAFAAAARAPPPALACCRAAAPRPPPRCTHAPAAFLSFPAPLAYLPAPRRHVISGAPPRCRRPCAAWQP